ncbi:site-specific DNA-methyltransferase [Winogradskyella undariae]|uniref:site-specific DNA-methyltransferase n=1 Tax=Winogradskyella undariae TaxID=1285465 RepID=UPI00156B4D94|nr:site-specific DNA-methyltransferase [Winogradskyella undariae]NRR91404.1 site-specific DNA-methyltransferase [Winogradskyella undariae]
MPTLNWIGKEKVINHHQDVPYKTLEPQYTFTNGKESNDATSQNKIIHGDNLEALKSLLPAYEGKIDCVYIDPPYNTGNEEWKYNDNVSHPRFKKWLGEIVGKEGEDLSRHDKWLCMMYPRLRLISKLLSKDGGLVISIGYHEIANLTILCKEIFATRQIITITIQTSGGKPSKGFNYQHEYLIYIVPKDFNPNNLKHSGGKSRSPFEGLTLATFDKIQRPNQTYPIFVNLKDGKLHSTGKSLQERIDTGEYTKDKKSFIYNYNEAPEGTCAIWPVTSKGKNCVWRLISSRLQSDWKKGYIKISPNRSNTAKNKFSIQYLPSGVIKKINSKILEVTGTENNSPTLAFGDNKTEGSQIPTLWLEKDFYTVKGTNLLKDIFKEKMFDYPKSHELIEEIIRSISHPNSIVLDSFAGSGTTAHAVLNLNKENGGNRKFILVEMEDYANTITGERVKRVINGYGEGSKAIEGTGGDFTYYELGEPLFLDNGFLNEDIELDKILEYVWYSEAKAPFIKPKEGYLLGAKNDTAYYFYYQKDSITTLDESFLRSIKSKASQYIIYADNCLLDQSIMDKYNIVFKKIPRDITRF